MTILPHGNETSNVDECAPDARHPAVAEVDTPLHYDLDQIKDALRVDAVLGRFDVYVDEDAKNMACPLHDGDGQTAFSIFDEGRRWRCHSECDESGDVISLIIRAREWPSRPIMSSSAV